METRSETLDISVRPPSRRWEIRSCFLTALIGTLCVANMQHITTLAATSLFVFFVLQTIGSAFRELYRRLKCVAPFLLFSFATLLLSDGIPITWEAAKFAILTAARITTCVFVVSLLKRRDIQEYLAGFQAMKFPSVFTATFFLTQRYLHLLLRQTKATLASLKSRLFSPSLRLKSLKVYGQIIGGMTIKAIDQSEIIRQAMESRGFSGQIRTRKADSIRCTDLFKSVAVILVFLLILIAEKLYFTNT
ncbi:MAG: energy-coupling factor transporter transmembrane protein EcfT [Planctomycetaceae bacterium]|jgi:cobalt/nickel transport system permease protein|nr:energy-coupling factor transporter transmembrane protein EcfT [Planctomycetaceae bacterium]